MRNISLKLASDIINQANKVIDKASIIIDKISSTMGPMCLKRYV